METVWELKLGTIHCTYIYSEYTLDIYVYIWFSVVYYKPFIETFFYFK